MHEEEADNTMDEIIGNLEDDDISLDGSITEMIATVDDAKKIPLDNSIRARLRAKVSKIRNLQGQYIC